MRVQVGRAAAFRRLAGLAGAAVLAVVLTVSPVAVRVASAADTLRLAADATYVLDPPAGRVHVAIKVKATNLKPSTATTVYFYRDLFFWIQPDARSVRVVDDAGNLSITTEQRRFHVETNVHLRSNLYYQHSTTFTIRYDLVGGAPRSESPIRVGRAFATFGVWAWGDPGRSSVEVRTPQGFGSQYVGGPMQIVNASGGQTLLAEPAAPGSFYAIISAENRGAYGSRRISLPGDVEIVVMAWPEDDLWEATVGDTLEQGLPELQELIGLDWPVAHDLTVRERSTPSLEGYAGIFFSDDQRIDVSEDLDPTTIVHEASHAWFNGALFSDRWVTEGLAEEYAWRVQTAVGGDAGDPPKEPDLQDPGRTRLDGWTFPQVIRDQETDDRERYGYQAAFWVMHGIVDAAGVDTMRAAFAAADADLTAYPGAGSPEKVAEKDSWRRFLDLVEPSDEPTPRVIDDLMRDYVLDARDYPDLAERRATRADYLELVEAGEGWLPPWYIRRPMGEWRFDEATRRIEEATAALALRDKVATAATALELEPDDALRTAYESTDDGFADATALAEAQLSALRAIDQARTSVAIEPDLVASIGLLGETSPGTPYAAAREAFERGELGAAGDAAAAAVAIVSGAAAIGQQRILLAAIGAAGVLLLLALLAVAIRRRRRRRRLALAGAAAAAPVPMPVGWPDAGSTEAYATLAADPEAVVPPAAARPPDVEGGVPPREPPSDP